MTNSPKEISCLAHAAEAALGPNVDITTRSGPNVDIFTASAGNAALTHNVDHLRNEKKTVMIQKGPGGEIVAAERKSTVDEQGVSTKTGGPDAGLFSKNDLEKVAENRRNAFTTSRLTNGCP